MVFIKLILIDCFSVFVKCFYKYMVHELGVGKISEIIKCIRIYLL